jgi:hypothetical protein
MRLNIPVDKIVTTTNYLEAFNGVLKQKFIGQLQKGGRWLRFDLLIFLLIKQILPSIFIQRQLESSYYQWLSEQFQAKTGRQNIKSWSVSHHTSPSKISHGSSPAFKYAWWHMESGADRQDEVSYMIKTHQIGPYHWSSTYTLTTTCASSLVDIRDPNHIRYWLFMNPYGWSSCSCPAFCLSGVACKHLWAFRRVLPQLNLLYGFIFPTTETAAKQIFSMLFPINPSLDTSVCSGPSVPPLDTSIKSLPQELQNIAKDIQPHAIELIEVLTEIEDHNNEDASDEEDQDQIIENEAQTHTFPVCG